MQEVEIYQENYNSYLTYFNQRFKALMNSNIQTMTNPWQVKVSRRIGGKWRRQCSRCSKHYVTKEGLRKHFKLCHDTEKSIQTEDIGLEPLKPRYGFSDYGLTVAAILFETHPEIGNDVINYIVTFFIPDIKHLRAREKVMKQYKNIFEDNMIYWVYDWYVYRNRWRWCFNNKRSTSRFIHVDYHYQRIELQDRNLVIRNEMTNQIEFL